MADQNLDCHDRRFVIEQDIDINLHCPICFGLLKDPMQCDRNQHYFCRSCIQRHLEQNSKTCPMCQEKLTTKTLAKPPRILIELLSALKMRCDYFERGCAELIDLHSLNNHVLNCGYSPVFCGNDGCFEIINKQDKEQHETKVCEFRVLKCQDCGKDVSYVTYKTHNCVVKEDMRAIKTELTEVKVVLGEIKDQLGMMKHHMQYHHKRVMKELREYTVGLEEPMNISQTTQRAEPKQKLTNSKNTFDNHHHVQTRQNILATAWRKRRKAED